MRSPRMQCGWRKSKGWRRTAPVWRCDAATEAEFAKIWLVMFFPNSCEFGYISSTTRQLISMPPVRPNIAEMKGYTPGEQPQGVEKFIKLNTNENPYQCSPKVKAAIGRVVQAGLQKYPDPLATAFRIRAAELHGIDPDWILCGNGSDDILTIVTRAFVGTSDMVRFANPSYVLYRTLAEIQGAACDIVNYNPDWSLPDEFAAANDWIRLVFLTTPNSPSGTT